MLTLVSILIADGDDFVSRPIATTELVFGGIAGDLHAGPTRKACARVPWHRRGTLIANTRQLTLVSVEECAEIARRLDIAAFDPGLLGANLVVSGVEDFSAIAPSARLQFPSGATVFVTEENAPCRQPGRKLAAAFDRPELQFDFVREALNHRGLLGIVEREGTISPGDEIRVIAPRQRG
jgi:hypothetical protein